MAEDTADRFPHALAAGRIGGPGDVVVGSADVVAPGHAFHPLALFLVPVTLIFHGFWHADAAEVQTS